jgi:hypothetical protein
MTSAADALPTLSRTELDRLAADFRRIVARGGHEGKPWSEEFKASAREAYTECLAEVKAAEARAATGSQPALFILQDKSRAA